MYVSRTVFKRPWDFPGGPVAKALVSNVGGLGRSPGWGTGSHTLQLKIPHPTKTQGSQINKERKKNVCFFLIGGFGVKD